MLRENLVYRQLQHVLNHPRKYGLQELTWLFETWIRVYFYEPTVEILVDYKVVAEHLEAVLALVWVDRFANRVNRFDNLLFHRWHQVFINIYTASWVLVLYNLLEARVAQLVSVLKLAIWIKLLLHSVVGQVNSRVVNVLKVDVEFCSWRPNVAFLEQIQVQILVE